VESVHSGSVAKASAEPLTQAFREIFDENAAMVWRALRHFGVGEREVEDAVQELFLVVHRKLAEGTEPEHRRAWLYGIAWRVAAAHRRKARLREIPTSEVEPEPDSSRDPARLLEQQKRLVRLDQALSSLPDEQRAVFVLYELEELTMREIAQSLSCSINTAFSRLYAARRKVIDTLGLTVPEEVWTR